MIAHAATPVSYTMRGRAGIGTGVKPMPIAGERERKRRMEEKKRLIVACIRKKYLI